MSILSSIRQPLATALAGVSANVFTHVPENVPVPAVILVPDSPYLELETINKSVLHASNMLVADIRVSTYYTN